jgi:two-component system, cell cycle response regulator
MAAKTKLTLNNLNLEKLKQCTQVIDSIYDSMRIVDPIGKKVLKWDDYILLETEEPCYNIWCRGNMCENCVAARANSEKKCIIKLEPGAEFIMMVTAIPVNYQQQSLVVELLKDVTDSLLFGPENNISVEQAYKALSELSTMVITDYLTSLYNRRFVDDRLEADINKAVREEQPLSILFIDIDDLKSYNDTYGHIMGDAILKAAANAINQCIRTGNDWAARYGGDEFLVCLNDTNDQVARLVAERILDNTRKITLPIQDKLIRFSFSIGIHTMKQQTLTAADIVKIADQRMYEAKLDGKKRFSQSIDSSITPLSLER